MKNEIQIQSIRKIIEREAASMKYFSVYALFEEGQKEIPIAEKAKGVEAYNEAIDYAKENNAIEIIIVGFAKKTDPRTKKNEYRIRTSNSKAQSEVSEEKILGLIDDKMQTLKETLSGLKEDPSGLGLIRQEYNHQSELLRTETRHKFKIIEFERKIETLERQIAEKDETILEEREEIEALKSEIEEIEDEFEKYKDDKFAGLSEQLSAAGKNMLSGLAAKAIPFLTGGNPNGFEGLTGGEEKTDKSTTIVEDDTNPVIEKAINEIRNVISAFNETQFKQFYELMVFLATNPEQNIATLHDLIKQ